MNLAHRLLKEQISLDLAFMMAGQIGRAATNAKAGALDEARLPALIESKDQACLLLVDCFSAKFLALSVLALSLSTPHLRGLQAHSRIAVCAIL